MRGPQLETPARASAGATAGGSDVRSGAAIRARPSDNPVEIDARATIVHAVANTGSVRPRIEDLHEVVRAPVGHRRFVFVVDASGSQAPQQRMRFVKGAAVAMLEQSAHRRDEVAIIAFRGAAANLVLPPTCSVDDAVAALAYLPTGGRTPLAHGLELGRGNAVLTDRHDFDRSDRRPRERSQPKRRCLGGCADGCRRLPGCATSWSTPRMHCTRRDVHGGSRRCSRPRTSGWTRWTTSRCCS